jgi:hypothetical protein
MANNRTITAANSILILSTDLFGIHRLQGFAADAITETDGIQQAETMMGVDGRLSGGYVPAPTVQNITLQGDSLSNDYMDQIAGQAEQLRETVIITGSLVLPAIGQKYAMRRGFLTNYPKFPSVQRVIQPRRYQITWEAVTPSPN